MDNDGQPKREAVRAKEKARREKINNKAISEICDTICDEYLREVEDIEDAKEVWEKLRTLNHDVDFLYEVMVLRELLNVKKENMSVAEYIEKISKLSKQVKTCLELEFSDKTLAAIALAGLPKDMDVMIRTLDKSKLNLSYIKTQLKQEEMRMKKEEEEEASAFLVKERFPYDTKKQEKAICQEAGNQPCEGQHSSSTEENRKPEYRCFNCNGRNHVARYCKKPPNPQHQRQDNRNATKNQSQETSKPNSGSARSAVVNEVRALCASSQSAGGNKGVWIIDTGPTHHLCLDKNVFENLEETSGHVTLADGSKMEIKGIGTVLLKTEAKHSTYDLRLSEVYYVPGLSENLISLGLIEKKGFKIVFCKGKVQFIDRKDGAVLLTSFKEGNLWTVYSRGYGQKSEATNIKDEEVRASRATVDLWHRRLAHCHEDALVKIEQLNLKRVGEISKSTCDTCVQGKMTKLPMPKKKIPRSKGPLDLIHSDVCGPISPASLGKARYFVTFIDDFTGYTMIAVIKNKSDVFSEFLAYQAEVELFHDSKIKGFQSDHGTEYVNQKFKDHFRKTGIVHFKSVPYVQAQDGKSERMNYTLLNGTRCVMIESGVPAHFWAEALRTVTKVRNRCPSAAINFKIPEEEWIGRNITVEELNMVKIFGCRAWAAVPDAPKLGCRAEECVHLGLGDHIKGYRLWNIEEESHHPKGRYLPRGYLPIQTRKRGGSTGEGTKFPGADKIGK